ncbi:MAG: DUF3717 domain-containing protein [Rhodocyclaceae bacterium]|nr:DUF3717 domain-containing protein [Rhodocyclaceae bacterium]
MASSSAELVLYCDVHEAISSCMAHEPAIGEERALSADASALAEVLGELIWRKAQAIDIQSLTPRQREAIRRWRPIKDHAVD